MNASICAKAATLFYLIVGSSTGWAAPILSIEPAAAVVPAGPFSVDINIANVTDLFAFQFDLTFTPGILAASGSAEGPFLATSGAGTTFFPAGLAAERSAPSVAHCLAQLSVHPEAENWQRWILSVSGKGLRR
ncbi:MAG: hypothetical protein JOY85_10685 [Acidobacteriaceae bacterium]|nr:hypothetical protein [Acidobacteriaceae bacterium]